MQDELFQVWEELDETRRQRDLAETMLMREQDASTRMAARSVSGPRASTKLGEWHAFPEDATAEEVWEMATKLEAQVREEAAATAEASSALPLPDATATISATISREALARLFLGVRSTAAQALVKLPDSEEDCLDLVERMFELTDLTRRGCLVGAEMGDAHALAHACPCRYACA